MIQTLVRRGPLLGITALLVASYAALTVSAVLARPYIFGTILVISAALDVVIERRFPPVVAVLRQAQFGISHRAFAQVFLLLLLVAITDANRDMGRLELLLITTLALALPVARIGYLGVLTLIRRRVTPPVETRNIDVPYEFRPMELPSIFTKSVGQRLLILSVPPILLGALGVGWEVMPFWPFSVAAGTYVLVVGLAGMYLLHTLSSLKKRLAGRQQMLDAVSQAVRQIAPEVILYFSGSPTSHYQVEMWYSTLQRMPRRSLIVVRGRHAIQGLARTDLPIVCIPSAVDLMNFSLPAARISLYVTNVGNNIHFMREPRVKHVFIGHGDSDKVASFNPFSKAYDEIWVAGQAGRDRYARAKVGVRDEQIVEVGRPQLDTLERQLRRDLDDEPWPTRDQPMTVLYAPTWEGWTDDGFQTSVVEMSVDIVKRLLNSPLPLRVIYKPHPLIGTRDPRAKSADEKIRSMIRQAAATQPAPDESSLVRLRQLSERLAAPDLIDAEEEGLLHDWNTTYWTANQGRHLVVAEKLPRLFDCFNAADLLITDVSSLISDWLASGKPYVVSNPKAMTDDEFRTEFPSARAAYLLHPGCAEIDDILDSVVDDDKMAPVREEEKRYLLGPDEPAAQIRWNAAAEALIARATTEWEDVHGTGPSVSHVEVIEDEGTASITEAVAERTVARNGELDVNGAAGSAAGGEFEQTAVAEKPVD